MIEKLWKSKHNPEALPHLTLKKQFAKWFNMLTELKWVWSIKIVLNWNRVKSKKAIVFNELIFQPIQPKNLSKLNENKTIKRDTFHEKKSSLCVRNVSQK